MKENTFLKAVEKELNYTLTENGAVAHKSSLIGVYDLFSFGGAYRDRTDEECKDLFLRAWDEDPELATKCLFYLRDIRGGQGERRFFRICFQYLAKIDTKRAIRNISNIPEYGRYDDLFCLINTPAEIPMFNFIRKQLEVDMKSLKAGEKYGVSLLGKWLKSENASSLETIAIANRTRLFLGMTHVQYRKMLSALRKRINIVERLMSENRWEEIEFEKLPSKAGFIYANAFAHKDMIAEKYKRFIEDQDTKVNAKTLYPYEIVEEAMEATCSNSAIINKYWENLPDYINGANSKTLCVVDTSASMLYSRAINSRCRPIHVAISLGMYCAEKLEGAFKNYYITFSSVPQLIRIEGINFVDKVKRIKSRMINDNTDLIKVFKLLRSVYMNKKVREEDMPERIIVISDMEIDGENNYFIGLANNGKNKDEIYTEMEEERKYWEQEGLTMPKLVYWNVNATNNIMLEDASRPGISFVSGFSPVLFEGILQGKSGWDLCYDKLMSERYSKVK